MKSDLDAILNAEEGFGEDFFAFDDRGWNVSLDNESAVANETSGGLPSYLQFHEGNIIQIVSNSIIMLISGLGNVFVLMNLRKKAQPLSRVNALIFHLAIADLLVTFLLVPVEIGWAITVAWKGGDFLCRFMAFFRTFGIYLSGFVITSISMDRYLAITSPLTVGDATRRTRRMITMSWIVSAFLSSPQVLIFHVQSHPDHKDFEQCVTFDSFPNKTTELAYCLIGFLGMYLIPFLTMVYCYGGIVVQLYCRKRAPEAPSQDFATDASDQDERMTRTLSRAKMKTIKMTVFIVLAFFACWGPYNVMVIWYWADQETAKNVDTRIQRALFLFAHANSCINPFLYGLFKVRPRRRFYRYKYAAAAKRDRQSPNCRQWIPLLWRAKSSSTTPEGLEPRRNAYRGNGHHHHHYHHHHHPGQNFALTPMTFETHAPPNVRVNNQNPQPQKDHHIEEFV